MVKKIVFLLCVLSVASAQAETENETGRSDFLVGIAFGLGSTDADFSNRSDAGFTVYERPMLMSSFKLGGMFAPQHALYYQYRLGVMRMARSDWDDDYQGVATFSGLGYSYFLEPTVGSPYVEAAMGVNRFSLSGDINEGDFEGFGFLIGAGNEFNRHMQMGAVLEIGDSINRSSHESLQLKTLTFQLEYKF